MADIWLHFYNVMKGVSCFVYLIHVIAEVEGFCFSETLLSFRNEPMGLERGSCRRGGRGISLHLRYSFSNTFFQKTGRRKRKNRVREKEHVGDLHQRVSNPKLFQSSSRRTSAGEPRVRERLKQQRRKERKPKRKRMP